MEPWRILEQPALDDRGQPVSLRIGVIGFVPPQIMLWDKGHLEGRVTALDIVDAGRMHLPALLAQEPDLVVALCHSGIAVGPRQGGEENAALHLAGLDGIDVVICGHQHLLFPGAPAFDDLEGVDNRRGTLAGKPACQPGLNGSHLGVIDLVLQRQGERWRPTAFSVENRAIAQPDPQGRPVPTVPSEPALVEAVASDHAATLAYMEEPVGMTRAPIDSFFALVTDDPSVQIVADAQIAYARRLIAGTALEGLPVLSATAPFKAGGRAGPGFYTNIPAGPLALRNIADLYLYPNTLQILKVTGAQIRQWLERGAALFNRIDPNRADEQPLIDESYPAFNFDVIDGVSYRIDVTRPARYDLHGALVAPESQRVLDLAFKGRPIDEDASFLIATNNYRASGGGGFPGTGSTVVIEAPDLVRDVVARHVREKRVLDPATDANWSLAPLPEGVFATFPTSPAAAGHAPPSIRAEPIGSWPGGFAKWRLLG